MTTEEIREAAKVMEAYASGKKIQYLDGYNKWIDATNPSFNWSDYIFRIKPEPKFRPFKTHGECWNEMLKHQPFGWVTDKCKYVHIVCVRQSNIEFNPDTDDNVLYSCIMTFADVLEQGYTFADGTPFGIKDE